ncbi:hypothetical protein [Anaerobacillus alkalilacustris]|nr:hypothetical protein [Anaerobacillus alkalilacustris]
MENRSKEQMSKEGKNKQQQKVDRTPGYGDKKLEGPDRPST